MKTVFSSKSLVLLFFNPFSVMESLVENLKMFPSASVGVKKGISPFQYSALFFVGVPPPKRSATAKILE